MWHDRWLGLHVRKVWNRLLMKQARSRRDHAVADDYIHTMKNQILARKERVAREAVFPDLRNVGILARALILYVAMVLAYALAISAHPNELVINIAVVLAGG